jgi:hypothetical protein
MRIDARQRYCDANRLNLSLQISIFSCRVEVKLTDHQGKATPSLSPNPIVGSSEKHLISQAISVIRIFLCLALTGCSQGDFPTASTSNLPPPPPPPHAAPVISSGISIAPSGLRVTASATVNPNGLETSCYFEYGQTTAYGSQLPTKSIGAGKSDIVVSDTIAVPVPATTIHCRLVAVNSDGRTESADRAISFVEFVFPLEAGATWHYTYRWSYSQYPRNEEVRGHQVWRSNGPEKPNSVKILVTRIDTMRSWYSYLNADTTTQITQVDTSFSIILTPDSLYIQWYQLARHGYWSQMQSLFSILRMVVQNTDTLTLQFSKMKAIYVSGKGLTSWEDNNVTMTYWDERLILESMSP